MAASTEQSGEFRLDVPAAQAAVRELERVRDRLESLAEQADDLARIPPSAQDLVSLEAFALLQQKASGGPGSFAAAMLAGKDHVQALVDQMNSDISRQEQIDAAASGGPTDRA